MSRLDRVDISYTLNFLTPFHCGTGLSNGALDRTVVRDAEDYLYVPGSTIKGVMREYCERLARSYETKDMAEHEKVVGPFDMKHALYDLGGHFSMVTRIFGRPAYPGLLYFDDARQSTSQKNDYDSGGTKDSQKRYLQTQTGSYTQVRLDRPTGTAVQGALYTSEFGIRGLSFEGKVSGMLRCLPIPDIENGPTYSLLLLLAGFHLIERIGGNKSTGKGQCSCEITEVRLNGGQEAINRDTWQSWFAYLDYLSLYATSVALEEEGI